MADPRAPINECLGSAALSVMGALQSVYLCAHVLVATLNPAFFSLDTIHDIGMVAPWLT